MKRLHIHIHVADLDQSVRFYASLFGTEPTVVKEDYAKWMLEDPRVNFAVSVHSGAVGINHLGIQTETPEELAIITDRLQAAEAQIFQQENANCCYARSDKTWVADPSGVRWESFFTHSEATTYGADATVSAVPVPLAAPSEPLKPTACCAV